MPPIRQSDEKIAEAYRTPGHPVAFSSPQTVADHFSITKERAKKILEGIDSYTLHREFKRPRVFNPYYVYKRREQAQGDLIDIRSLSKENDGTNHLLLLIDVFSRRVWVYPLKTKTGIECERNLRKWLASLSKTPRQIIFDGGGEFFNAHVQNLLRSYRITLTLATGTSKAAYAERANKTLQVLIYKYLTDRETLRYIDVLDEIVNSYNNRGHRSLNFMTPLQADNPRNSPEVRRIFRERWDKIRKKAPKYKVGDVVRIKISDPQKVHTSSRAYAEQFKGEYFHVIRINRRLPIPMYYLKSWDTDEIIDGAFYENELSLIRGDVFKIEKILKRRRRGRNTQLLVRWKYFGPCWDKWINEQDVIETF
jgi:Integrase core domain